MKNTMYIIVGSALLAMGICSPMISVRVNEYGPELIGYGLLLVCGGLWLDHKKDQRAE